MRSSSETGETLECPAASTLFYLTRRAMLDGGAPPGLAERARRVRCVYTEGFGRVRQGQYPRMSPSYLTALEPPLGPKEDREHTSITEFGYGAGETHWLAADTFADCCEKDEQEMERDVFRHSLVQRDEDGRECVVVTWTCLNCLEELDDGGAWRQLEYEDARTLVEGLLGRASAPPHLLAVDWAPGDCVIFDNLCVQHSVTPTDAYAFAPNRRLMVRTAVEPRRLVLRTLPAVRPLPSGCGARVEGLGAADVLEAMELEERDGGGAVTAILTEGLRAHGMLWFRGSERPGRRSLSPAEIQGLYERIHKSRYPEYDFAAMKEDEGTREEEARQPRATLPAAVATRADAGRTRRGRRRDVQRAGVLRHGHARRRVRRAELQRAERPLRGGPGEGVPRGLRGDEPEELEQKVNAPRGARARTTTRPGHGRGSVPIQGASGGRPAGGQFTYK